MTSLLSHLPFLFAQADTPVDSPSSSPMFTMNGQELTPDQMHALAGNAAAFGLIGVLVGVLFFFVISAFLFWKIFTKAGRPGWASIIPFYNLIVLLQIAGRPGWWFLLMCIPVLNFIMLIILCIDLAKSFGKDAAFGIGLAFLGIIFYPILGFGSARYVGPAALMGTGPGGYPGGPVPPAI